VTGFRVYRRAEQLIGANVVVAILFLALGGVTALIVLLTRTVPGAFPPDLFYQSLSLHGWSMLIFWIIFFEIALLYFASSVMLSTRLALPGLATSGFVLMLLGALIVTLSHLSPRNWLMFTNYVPLKGDWSLYLGANLFLVGALAAGAVYFVTIYVAMREKTHSLPLIAFGGFTAAVLAATTIVPGLITYIPRLLWSAGIIPYIDPVIDKLSFWAIGHPAQQINLAATITVWYALALFTTGGTTPSEKVSRLAFVLYLFSIQLGSAHHLQTEPIFSVLWKWVNTGYAMHAAVLGSMLHAFAVPGAIEVALRLQGHNQGLFTWLRRAPWRNPAFSSLILSILGFGFWGGVTGVVYGMEQSNLQWHNTVAVVGHFKGVVVLGTTLAFMGLTWIAIPLILRREVKWFRLAQVQPWLFGLGNMLLASGLLGSGLLYGMPRRSADAFTFGGSPFAFPWPAELSPILAIWLIGGLLAFVGGVLYVVIAVASVLGGGGGGVDG
jgi:cytochrome c oxidase subunit 1